MARSFCPMRLKPSVMKSSCSKDIKMQNTYSNIDPHTGKTVEQLIKSNAEEKARLAAANYPPAFVIVERKTK